MSFLGAPYPLIKHPRGFFRTQSGVNQIKADLLQLLLTEPGERVMLPDFGTRLKKFIFEMNDSSTLEQVREEIANAIGTWEPRIAVQAIEVTSGSDINSSLDPNDLRQDLAHIILIKIRFTNFEDIQKVEELRLELPAGG
jgi:uncharacterized protein